MFQCFLPYIRKTEKTSQPQLLYFAKSDDKGVLPQRMMHEHKDRMEIIFVFGGKGVHTIGDRQYFTQKGDVILVNPNTLHEEAADIEQGMMVYCCGISGVQFPNLKKNYIIQEKFSPVLHSGVLEPHILGILTCMYEQVLKKKEKAFDVYQPLLMALIALIRQIPAEEEAWEMEQQANIVVRIKRYLNEHYNEVCSLEQVAKAMNMSVSYLAHCFKASTGCSPNKYLIRRRIGEAQTLLTITQYPVTMVSSMVGYDNSNYFSTLFTNMVRLSPREYRNYWECNKD